MPNATYQQFWRVRTEASFNAASPEGGAEWNIGGNGGGANGWMDLPVIRESDGLQPKTAIIYPSTASGNRAMNAALPIAGAHLLELGNLEFAFYPELADRMLRAVFGSVSRAETAGTAALVATAFASLATLDTQPDGTEQLKFTIASSTAATAAAINIVQNATVQETITIGTSASSVDGVYYSKGAYNGSVNAITFTVAGTVTAGTVAVAGVDYSTNEFTAGTSNPTLVIEQAGRTEPASGNSEYFAGVVVPTMVLNYDRSAPDNLLMCNATLQGVQPSAGHATAGTYSDDAAAYYTPLTGWHGSLTLDGGSYSEVVSASITIQPNNSLYAVSSGNQRPSGAIEGEFEVFGTMTILPDDDARWNDYEGQTVRDVELDFVTPFFVVDSTGYRALFEFTQFTIEDYTRNRQGQVLGAELAFRTVYDSVDGPLTLTTRCRMPA